MNSDLEFAFTIGTIDGLITALMIASRAILQDNLISSDFALRIALGSSVVGASSYLVAEYGRLRAEDAVVYRHLRPQGKSRISTRINREIFFDAFKGGAISLVMGFVGASIPLLSFSLFPKYHFLSPALSYITLVVLGMALGRRSGGRMILWSISLVILGLSLTILGFFIEVIA